MISKKPEIKSWDCADHDPIEEWQPDDPSLVEYWCNIAIGVKGEEGADNFQVHVVTEKMLPQIKDKNFMLVLPYYEGWNQVLDALNSKLEDINELNWSGMSEKLAKMFYWEYEGYQP
ncbi:Imm8 family immunity protein [Pseudomonadota bacterium]